MACPDDDNVTFTCTLPGNHIHWIVDPPPSSGFGSSAGIVDSTVQTFTIGVTGFMFQATLTNVSGENTTATLTTVTGVSLLKGSMVTCRVLGGVMESPLTITVAGEGHRVLVSVSKRKYIRYD